MDKVRVLLADDSRYMAFACRRILETQDHIEVVGLAVDGDDAVEQAERLGPDVVVLDVRMPKLSGTEAARRITDARPDTGIVMLSNYDDAEYIVELLRDNPGGKAYLLKTTIGDVDQLIRAVEDVAAGGIVLDPTIVERLMRSYAASPELLFHCLRKEQADVLAMMS